MARIEFPLAQGWCRGLTLHFEDEASSKALKLDESFLYVKQVHGNVVHNCGLQDLQRKSPLAEADGLLAEASFLRTHQKKLIIQTADCLPLIFIEREQEKIALIHAGWRGLLKQIHLKPFQSLGFRPESTWIWVGPSLNGKSFEVGADVWKEFKDFSMDEKVFSPHEANPEKRYFYVWNYLDKVYSSIKTELVYQTEVDTFTDLSFASYRRNKNLNGDEAAKVRNYAWVGF